jgi:hypothetical protein
VAQGLADQVGHGQRKAASFTRAAPRPCRTWLLAFVDGGGRPIVKVAGYGFSYQKAVNALKARAAGAGDGFEFENGTGTYLFVGEVSNGRYVLKLCADGMSVTQNRAGGWTVRPSAQ